MNSIIYEFSDYRSLEKIVNQSYGQANVVIKNSPGNYLSVAYLATALNHITQTYPDWSYKFIFDTNNEIENFFEGLTKKWHYFFFETEEVELYHKLKLIAQEYNVHLFSNLNEIM